jgi:hypothetical protein
LQKLKQTAFQAVFFTMSREALPAEGCKATKEDLFESDLKAIQDCPNCFKLGVECFVSNHPLRQSTGKFLVFLNRFM